jgi:hypothetical protein
MADMTCSQVEQAVTEYALGILAAEEARAVSVHVLRCPACRQEVEEIREIGEHLLDLVPDAEPPLGFDQKVLSAVRPHPARRSATLRVRLTVAVAAAVIVIAAITATAISSGHHPSSPTKLAAVLREGNRNIGTIYVGGHPTWIFMTVNHLSQNGTVSCQLITSNGTVTNVGTFELVDGSGSWGAPDPAGPSQLTAARLIGPAGNVLASASFTSG